jgi:hypothetical protein
MVSKTFSFRLTNAEVELLQGFQDPHGETLNQTAARLLREAIGANTANTANNTASSANIQELIIEEVEKAVSAIAPDRELIRDEIDNRTAYLATAMNEVKAQLENEIEFLKTRIKTLEKSQGEKRSTSLVTPEVTTKDATLSQPQEEIESAIAPEVTDQDVIFSQAGKLTSLEMRNKVKSIGRTLKTNGFKISETIIREKILEMYPNSEDWISEDARLDVIRALEKEQK